MISGVVLMSGGIDSTACAHLLVSKGYSIEGLFFDYGQAARKQESVAVDKVSEQLRINSKKRKVLPDQRFSEGELLGRNAFLIFSALMTMDKRNGLLAIGINRDSTYYDCSEVFFHRTQTIVGEYTDGQIGLVAPFLNWDKKDIVLYCKANGFDLSLTYSCENGEPRGCGYCLSCKERINVGLG